MSVLESERNIWSYSKHCLSILEIRYQFTDTHQQVDPEWQISVAQNPCNQNTLMRIYKYNVGQIRLKPKLHLSLLSIIHEELYLMRSRNMAEIDACGLTVLYPEAAVSPGAPASSFPPPPSARCSATDDNITVTPSAHISERLKNTRCKCRGVLVIQLNNPCYDERKRELLI